MSYLLLIFSLKYKTIGATHKIYKANLFEFLIIYDLILHYCYLQLIPSSGVKSDNFHTFCSIPRKIINNPFQNAYWIPTHSSPTLCYVYSFQWWLMSVVTFTRVLSCPKSPHRHGAISDKFDMKLREKYFFFS